MADRFPLILNTSNNQIQEIASGDNLDLTGTGISNAGVITATTFSGNLTGNVTGNINGNLTGTLQTAAQPNITSLGTLSSLNVSGNASIGGVLTYEDVTSVDSVGIITARAGINLTGGDITLGDSAGPHKLKFGAGADFQLFHNGSNNYIDVAGDGHLYIRPKANFYIQDYTNGEVWIDGTLNGGVKLYNNGIKKFETTSNGITVTGTATATAFSGSGGNITLGDSAGTTDDRLVLGAGSDLQVYHNGTDSAIVNSTGDFYITNNGDDLLLQGLDDVVIKTQGGADISIQCFGNGGTELYCDNNKRLETTSNGITVTGTATATTFSGSGASLTNLPAAQLSGTAAAINGSNITNVNAATVGGITAGSFLRSDASDVFNCNGNNLAFDFDNTNRDSIQFTMNGSPRWALVHENSGNDINFQKYNSAANIKIGGARILTTADEGTGNGLDADTVDGIQGSNIFTLAGNQTVTGTKTFDCSGYDYNFDYDTSRTLIRVQRNGTEKLKLSTSSDEIYVEMANSGTLRFETGLVPRTNDTYDLGSTSLRWANAYVNDLQLSNESKKDTGGNDVDGTWGDWTLQEGENDIFMINNRTGKKYSIIMKEV